MAGVPQNILSQPSTPPPFPLSNLTLNNLPPGPYGTSMVGGADPFNILSEGAGNPGGIYNEATSPGYQAYGNDWLNLIGTLGSVPNPNVSQGIVTGNLDLSNISPQLQSQISPLMQQLQTGINGATGGDPALISAYGVGNPQNQQLISQIQNIIDPFAIQTQDTFNPYNKGISAQIESGNDAGQSLSSLSSLAQPTVAKYFGLNPTSSDAQNYANAYTTDVLQTNNTANYQDSLQSQHQSGSFEQIFGEIGAAATEALAGGVMGSVASAATAADAAAGADTAFTATDALSAFNTGEKLIGLGQAAAGGNPLGIAEGAASIGSGFIGSTGSGGGVNVNATAAAAPTGGSDMGWFDNLFGSSADATTIDPTTGSSFPAGQNNPFGGSSPQSVLPQTSGGDFGGSSLFGNTAAAPTSSQANFLAGSPAVTGGVNGTPNIGQGPTVANAANLGAGAPAAGNSFSNLVNNPGFGTLGSFLSNNANILLPAAGLGYQAIQGNQTPKGQNQIQGQAAQLNSQGQQLQGYLQNGTLPPGVQQSLTQAADQAKAAIRSQYAARGMSGSSAEAQDLANVDQQVQSQGTNIAMQLLQQGVQETGMSSQLYNTIMNANLQQDQNLGGAISNFASSVAGGGGNQPKGTITFGGS